MNFVKKAAATMSLILLTSLICVQADPSALQQSAINRIEGYVVHFRRTGDLKEQLADLEQAAQDLTASYQEFIRQGDFASAALSQIKLGDARRMQDRATDAVQCCQDGLQLALKAHSKTNQALALIGLGRVDMNLKDFASAERHFEDAAELSADFADHDYSFDSLLRLGEAQVSSGDLIAAFGSFDRCLGFLPDLKNRWEALYAYIDRADVYLKLAEKCDYVTTFSPCYENLDLAKKDYLAALDIAREQEFGGLAKWIHGFLDDIENRRRRWKSLEQNLRKVSQLPCFNPKSVF
jgi:tetratricopeptide (TPR) repeat protein